MDFSFSLSVFYVAMPRCCPPAPFRVERPTYKWLFWLVKWTILYFRLTIRVWFSLWDSLPMISNILEKRRIVRTHKRESGESRSNKDRAFSKSLNQRAKVCKEIFAIVRLIDLEHLCNRKPPFFVKFKASLLSAFAIFVSKIRLLLLPIRFF